MNENETNVQNIISDQTLGTVNSNQSFQPRQEEAVPTIDLMDDFKDAVVSQPEMVVEPVTPTVIVPTESAVTAIKQPVEEAVAPVEPEIIEVQTEKIVRNDKKNNHWAFIFTLFAIVGAFVIVLPLLVRLFGY